MSRDLHIHSDRIYYGIESRVETGTSKGHPVHPRSLFSFIFKLSMYIMECLRLCKHSRTQASPNTYELLQYVIVQLE